MITLTESEKRSLAAQFCGIPDRELIRELVRRERFGQVRASVIIDNEMRDSADYMEYMRKRLAVTMGVELAKETERGYLVKEVPHPDTPYAIRPRTIRYADAIFLRAKEKEKPDAMPVDGRTSSDSYLHFEDRSDGR